MLRSRFSWITFACMILAAAFVVGCSMDSGNPMAPTVGDSDGFVPLDDAADHPQLVSDAQVPARVLAKRVGTAEEKEKKGSGGDEEPVYKKKTGPAHYAYGSRR